MDWGAIDRYAKSLIKEAGHLIRISFAGKIQIETKANANDLVTDIDQEVERFFISRIRRDFPGHRILGEEGFGDDVQSGEGVVWILDPIDGTMNFIHQRRNFAISLGIFAEGIGMLGYIYDVMADDFYHAFKDEGAYRNDERLPVLEPVEVSKAVIGVNASWVAPNRYIDHEAVGRLVADCRGTRSYGSAAIELAHVVTGRLDAYVSMRLAPWDVAGGAVIAKEVGAITTNLKGEQLDMLSKDTFIAARPGLHPAILEHYIHLKQQD